MALADRPWLRRGVGVCLVWHIVAVSVAPFAVIVGPREEPPGGGPPRPGSPATVATSPTGAATSDAASVPAASLPERHQPAIVRLEKNVFRWYLNALYLNHGYSFFAPDPGPSLVMEYEVQRKDGSTIRRGRLPDVERHWPRLLYHRYFMLTSQNLELMIQAEARGKAPAGSTRTLGHAIARQLTKRYHGDRTILRLFLHRLLWPEEVLAGKSPNAPDTYLPSGELTDVPSAAGGPKPVPARDMIPAEEVQP